MSESNSLEHIKQSFQYLTDEYNFMIVEARFSPDLFGNALVRYRSENVDITITVDRGQVLVDFTPVFDVTRRTYSFSTLLNYLSTENLWAVCTPSAKCDEYAAAVAPQVACLSRILKQYCSSVLLGQFTDWEYLGIR